MCGPLACSVLSRTRSQLGLKSLLYNGGRILSYSSAGAILGFFSQEITRWSLAFGTYLSLSLGGLLILWALTPRLKNLFATAGIKMPFSSYQSLLARLKQWPDLMQAFGLGLITVFLPCMTLHPLLLAAAGTQSSLRGACTMLAFALGTLPAMVTATYMPTLILHHLPSRWLSALGRLFLLLAGIITVWRAWPAA